MAENPQEMAREILPVNIEDELKQSYMDYAMSVIVGRALPDVRDGLKPVHRRVLFAMNELNNDWNKPYKKSARVVGDVIGKYHPHGDSAVYDTIVRMAQDFSLRYTLVDGQGNFGSIDGDSAAAMRYTEIRMSKIAHALLADLDKETVDFVDNYDGTEQIPAVLPTRVPNLLVNGSSGIAVGMATNIPPHNLREVVAGCLATLQDPEISVDELMQYIPGPDFPTGAQINGRAGIVQAYRTGRGRIYVRAKAEVITDEAKGKDTIIIHEIPYQLNKSRLIERIAELVKEKKLEGITELRDESDKDGLRVVIELRRGEVGDVVLNNLYAQTQLQSVVGINMVALVDGEPKVLNLKQMIEAFVRHRREIVTRRTVYLLRKARERGHVLEGLAIALANIDEVIELIKSSPTAADAREGLMARPWSPGDVMAMLERAGADACRPDDLPAHFGVHDGQYHLSPAQAQAILDLRLHRLTGLEHEKLLQEYADKIAEIADYLDILGDPDRLKQVIREELEELVEEFGDERKTQISDSAHDLTVEDLITEEDRVVTISHGGYAKTQSLTDYQAQRRGGTGRSATAVKDEDFVEHLLIASTHATILCFSNLGKVYWLKVFHIPLASRTARGRPMINLLPLDEGERITSILPIEGYETDHFIFMATANGTVKKTDMSLFSRQRSVGLRAIELDDDDVLVGTAVTDGSQDIMLFSSEGKVVRFAESAVRAMGRTARGVRGIKLAQGHSLISLVVPKEGSKILTVSENGYGKRSETQEFPVKGRGTKGVIGMTMSERNGSLVGAEQVWDGDEMMLISNQGTAVRTRVEEVSVQGRNTQGVRVIKTRDGEALVSVSRIAEDDIDAADPVPGLDQQVSGGEQPDDTGIAAADMADGLRGARHKRQFRGRRGPGRVTRAHNFCAGPAALPLPVLERAQAELMEWSGVGASVMEVSHRSAAFLSVAERAESSLRRLLSISDDYAVLFLQGGASLQFASVPLNLSAAGQTVDQVITGQWSKKACAEQQRFGPVNVVASSADCGFTRVPPEAEWQPDASAAYLHYCPNETIGGLEFSFVPEVATPIVADMSSTLLSRPIDVNRFGVIYAGAQKNIGPAGLCLVIVRRELLGRAREETPTMLDWQVQPITILCTTLPLPSRFIWRGSFLNGWRVSVVLRQCSKSTAERPQSYMS